MEYIDSEDVPLFRWFGVFARWPGCGDVAQDRGEHRDRYRVFNPLRKTVLDS